MSSRPAETNVSEGVGSKDPAMHTSWVPKLASKASSNRDGAGDPSRGECQRSVEALEIQSGESDYELESPKKEDTVSETASLHGDTCARPPFPSLAELRAQVDRQLLQANTGRNDRNHWQVFEENIKLSRDLRMARSELEVGEIREGWQEEVEFWKKEVVKLEAEVLEQRRQREEATEVMSASASAGKAADPPKDVRSEVVALSKAERELAELAKEQARCEAAAKEAEARNATLRRSLKQGGLERGGAARLFVNALPALDAQAVEVARTALNVHMQKMKMQSQAAKS